MVKKLLSMGVISLSTLPLCNLAKTRFLPDLGRKNDNSLTFIFGSELSLSTLYLQHAYYVNFVNIRKLRVLLGTFDYDRMMNCLELCLVRPPSKD